jgi:quercetin dioxygenase-like cupin family protein
MERKCENLEADIDSFLADGYRLDMIMPADSPRVALLSKRDHRVRLTANPRSGIPNPQSTAGRAGMEYRDLIPDRLGGLVIASHIKITRGGEVPDYIHYHKLSFQMIYCLSGWIRVVYEDQGPPFGLNPGDCVLQPPQLRHRVIEASTGAEVVELSSPAEHETWVDHDMELPSETVIADRLYGGQKFVESQATWTTRGNSRYRDLGIDEATAGLVDAKICRAIRPVEIHLPSERVSFLFVLDGLLVSPDVERVRLSAGDCFVSSPKSYPGAIVTMEPGCELLHVTMSPELDHRFLASSVPTDREP